MILEFDEPTFERFCLVPNLSLGIKVHVDSDMGLSSMGA